MLGFQAQAAQRQYRARPLRIFWKGFIRGPEEPWVVFSNAQFVAGPTPACDIYDPAKDAKLPILDHYTEWEKCWRCTIWTSSSANCIRRCG